MTPSELLNAEVDWYQTPEDQFAFVASVNGVNCRLRLNAFPAEPFCTIYIGTEHYDLNAFGEKWTLPTHREKGNSPRADE